MNLLTQIFKKQPKPFSEIVFGKNKEILERVSYNLNLHPNYVRSWGVDTVVREIVSNAFDADPDNFHIEALGSNRVRIHTSTMPNVGEILVIGEGSKCQNGSTIGQFGEGLKMAALVATRNNSKSGMVCYGKDFVIRFEFQKLLGSESLYAVISKVSENPELKYPEGFTVEINLPNATKLAGQVYDSSLAEGPTFDHKSRIFCKGIWICNNKDFIHTWNLSNLTLNRDRTHVVNKDIVTSISSWVYANYTDDIIKRFLEEHSSYTIKDWSDINHVYAPYHFCQAVRNVFEEKYEKEPYITREFATSDIHIKTLRSLGYNIVIVNIILYGILEKAGCKLASHINYEPEPAEIKNAYNVYKKQLDDIEKIREKTDLPKFQIKVYQKGKLGTILGLAEYRRSVIWISEEQLQNNKYIGTYLHELAHLISKASDETLKFEYELTRLLNLLGQELLT